MPDCAVQGAEDRAFGAELGLSVEFWLTSRNSRVAAGVAPGGSHGSGRAEFPHPALQVTVSLRGRCCERPEAAGEDTAPTAGGIAPSSSARAGFDGRATFARRF